MQTHASLLLFFKMLSSCSSSGGSPWKWLMSANFCYISFWASASRSRCLLLFIDLLDFIEVIVLPSLLLREARLLVVGPLNKFVFSAASLANFSASYFL